MFNKAGRHFKQKFLFNGNEIECVSQYKYLGIQFCASGSFSPAQKELYSKALKGYYKLRRDFISFGPNVKNSIHVFDHTIKPILLYGSEVWGYFNPFKKRLQSNDLVLDQIYLNLEIEKLHIKFSKYILGVNKRATNFATLSELGRFPLHFDIIKSMIHYWYRLENLDSNFTLLKDAYEESKKLFEIKIPSWYGSITLLIKNIRGLKELSNVSKHKFKSSYKDVIYQVYKENWGKQMLKHSEGKLCSYSKFKTYFGLEKYLCILKAFEQRRNFNRFHHQTWGNRNCNQL